MKSRRLVPRLAAGTTFIALAGAAWIGVDGAGAGAAVLDCGLPATGTLTTSDVPEGTDVVACEAIDRPLHLGEVAVPIPEPGEGVMMVLHGVEDAYLEATATTSESGEIAYDVDAAGWEEHSSGDPAPNLPDEDQTGQGGDGVDSGSPDIDPRTGMGVGGCDYETYDLQPRKLASAIELEVTTGDGGEPGGVSAARTGEAIEDAGDIWRLETGPCFTEDKSNVPSINYGGTTTYVGDFITVNNDTRCAAERDGHNTVDIADLDPNHVVAQMCGRLREADGFDHLIEADIRFNTTNFDFTHTPWKDCHAVNDPDFDVLSTLTHEIGHLLGVAHPTNPALFESIFQTMHANGTACAKYARTLAKSDIRAVRARY